MTDITRPIIGIENRSAQEVFDIMVDRMRSVPAAIAVETKPIGDWVMVPREPTLEMIRAGVRAQSTEETYKVMIATAPKYGDAK